LKKFHALPSIWLAYGSYLYTQPARVSEARELLKRALGRCDKAEHIALITRWASLEFHVAHNVDRGRTLLEGVMSQYPKRVDLWGVYVDMEIKLAKRLAEAHAQTGAAAASVGKDGAALNHDSVRRLFERITSLSLSSKKMKGFYQRWLAFEKNHAGADSQRIAHIKDKARQFVASKAQEGDE
jgi:rRNA biogenesis protein RRP5